MDTKGRARRLPIRADIRRALCFPGGSILMISHLNEIPHGTGDCSIKLCLKSAMKSDSSTDKFYSLASTGEAFAPDSATSIGQENLKLNGQF